MSLNKFSQIFGRSRMAAIGMIHIKPTPGTPNSSLSVEKIVDFATSEAEVYRKSGIDAVLIENMADLPYLHSKDFGPELVATMTRIASEVRSCLPSTIPCGIQILAGGNNEALAVSMAAGLQFIRAEGFVFSHVADEGWMDACAGSLLRYRRAIGCEEVAIFTDIKKKHSSHAITSDISIEDTAKAAEFFLADGVIVTGTSTGKPADPEDLRRVRQSTDVPILIGSGISTENVDKFSDANGLIVGSHFKHSGRWDGELDESKIRMFMDKVHKIRMEVDEQ